MYTQGLFVCILLAYCGIAYSAKCGTCTLMKNSMNEELADITGTVTLRQEDENSNTVITLSASGFPATDDGSDHGFHIHQDSDSTEGCNSMGGHYNPAGVDHGAPDAEVRHVGDLGNVAISAEGAVSAMMEDAMVKLSGDTSVIGRSFVIHEGTDDLGLINSTASRTTGDAGSRLACCVIEDVTCAAHVIKTSGLLAALLVVFALLKNC